MAASALYRIETTDSFWAITPHVIHPEPRIVNNKFRFENKVSAKPFLAVSNMGVYVDTRKADELVIQTKALRRKHFWFLWKMYAPSRKVIKSTISVIRYCPSDLFLEGYRVANYGNGTVALMRRGKTFSATINVGSKAVSFAKLRLSDHKIVDSGSCPIDKKSIGRLFETL